MSFRFASVVQLVERRFCNPDAERVLAGSSPVTGSNEDSLLIRLSIGDKWCTSLLSNLI